MNGSIRKRDIENLDERIGQLSEEQRRSTNEILRRIDTTVSEIIAAVFAANRKLREDIGYQTIVLKVLEDNLRHTKFGEDTGVSSKIELSVGTELFGTGAKFVLDIDTGKASYAELLEKVAHLPGIPSKVKETLGRKMETLLGKS